MRFVPFLTAIALAAILLTLNFEKPEPIATANPVGDPLGRPPEVDRPLHAQRAPRRARALAVDGPSATKFEGPRSSIKRAAGSPEPEVTFDPTAYRVPTPNHGESFMAADEAARPIVTRTHLGDATEVRRVTGRLLAPGEDRPGTPRVGPVTAHPIGVGVPKPSADISVRLVIRAEGADGVEIKVNGRSVGTAPLEVELTVAPPGDIQVKGACDGFALVTHSMRLGDTHSGGRIDIALPMQADRPASGAGDEATHEPTQEAKKAGGTTSEVDRG